MGSAGTTEQNYTPIMMKGGPKGQAHYDLKVFGENDHLLLTLLTVAAALWPALCVPVGTHVSHKYMCHDLVDLFGRWY